MLKRCANNAAVVGDKRQQFLFLNNVSAIKDIASAWLELEKRSLEPCFFQSFAWCVHLAEIQRNACGDSYRPLVAVYVRDGVVRAIWPLSLRYQTFRWLLVPIDDPFGQFSGILAEVQDDADALVAALVEHVRELRMVAAMQFERVIVDGKLLAALRKVSGVNVFEVPGSSAPVVNVQDYPSFDVLRSSRNKKTMKNLRNSLNRLERAGPVIARVVRPGSDLDALVLQTIENRIAWMRKNAMASPAFRNPCHLEAIAGGNASGLSCSRVGFELSASGAPLAQQWGFIHNRRYYAYMSGSELAQAQMSPGRLHLAKTIEQSFALDVDAIEFLTPASPYKLTWTDQVRHLVDVSVEINFVGRATGAVWQRALRPALKFLYYGLPVSIRRCIPI